MGLSFSRPNSYSVCIDCDCINRNAWMNSWQKATVTLSMTIYQPILSNYSFFVQSQGFKEVWTYLKSLPEIELVYGVTKPKIKTRGHGPQSSAVYGIPFYKLLKKASLTLGNSSRSLTLYMTVSVGSLFCGINIIAEIFHGFCQCLVTIRLQ